MLVYLIPFISALIGWFTNFIAVKMLFHPREPINLGLFKLQGIFPKRQAHIAQNLGKVVAKELLSTNELKEKLVKPDNINALHAKISDRLYDYLTFQLPNKYPVIAMFVGEKTKAKVMDEVMLQIYDITPNVIDELMEKIEGSVNIEQMVSEKVTEFPADKFEQLLDKLLKNEFRFIELIGAILGFVIGCLQLLLLYFQGFLPSLQPLFDAITSLF